ncbi:T-cell-specific surface glycoprotein CD28 [Heteronotia binoei]|uniref:T-cell-specific surface glycoprotein CD28 n=1 Tax=Heteronotia binoei TaxID=13085 RepID=UPI00292D0A31|nr:T-cell-specific surface glycoprotein CD28 [Heteronotia binoei]
MMLWSLTVLSAVRLTSQTEKVISVVQPPRLIVENKNATIFCNFTCNSPQTKAFKVSMFKGTASDVEVCSANWNTSSRIDVVKRSEISCHMELNATVVMFSLYNLSVTHTDIYICKIEAVYPPPYHHGKGNGTVIHVKEELPRQREEPEHSSVMASALAIIACYSVAVTGALVYCRVRNKKKRLPRKDYHNMISWQVNSPTKRNSQPSVPARTYTTYRFWEP